MESLYPNSRPTTHKAVSIFPKAYSWVSNQINLIITNLEAFNSIDYSDLINRMNDLRKNHQDNIDELKSQFEIDLSYITISFDFDYEGETVEFESGEWSPGEEIEFDEDASEIIELLDDLFEGYKDTTLNDSYLYEEDAKEELKKLYYIVRDDLISEAIRTSVDGDRELTEDDFEDELSQNEQILEDNFEQYLADTSIDEAPLDDELIDFIKEKIKDEHIGDIESAFDEAQDRAIEEAEEEFDEIFINFIPNIKDFILESFEYSPNIDKEHLSSILNFIDDFIDHDEPIDGYLDQIKDELEKGFGNLGESLRHANRPKLVHDSINSIFGNKKLFDYLIRFEYAENSANHLEIQRTRYSILAVATKIIKAKLGEFQLSDYIANHEDYKSSLYIDLEAEEISRITVKKSIVSTKTDLTFEWKDELAEAENFYKIFPTDASAKSLTYKSSKNTKKHAETLSLDPIFSSMRINAQIAHRTLTLHVYMAKKGNIQPRLQESIETLENLNMHFHDKDLIVDSEKLNHKKLEKRKKEIEKSKLKLEQKIQQTVIDIARYQEDLLKTGSYIHQLEQLPPSTETVLKDSANAFLPCFIFLVSSGNADNQRKFFKVDFNVEWLPYITSTDTQDLIYHSLKQQINHAKAEDERFFEIIGERNEIYTLENSRSDRFKDGTKLEAFQTITSHSERVLTQALRNKEVVDHLVNELKIIMIKQGYNFNDGERYKVYSVTILGHSTNIVCHNCVRALVSQQSSYEDGTFLSLLTDAVNIEGSGLWAYKHGEVVKEKTRIGIRSSTIIISDQEYAEPQFTAIKSFSSVKVEFEGNLINIKKYNPQAIIELYKPELDMVVAKPAVNSKFTLSGSLATKLSSSAQEKKSIKEGGELEPSLTGKKQTLNDDVKDKLGSASDHGLLCIIASDSPETIKAFEELSKQLIFIGQEFHESHSKLLALEASSDSNNFELLTTAFAIQQGIEFSSTVSYFFRILGIELPKTNLSNQFWGILHFTTGIIKINKQNDLLPGQLIESLSYYAKLEIHDKLALQINNEKPTSFPSFINICGTDMTIGGTLGLASGAPIYGIISGASACLDKYQILQEESFIQTSVRYTLDSAVGVLAITALYQQNPLTCILGMINAIVITDITSRVLFSTIDLSLNGLNSEIDNNYYQI